MAHATPWGDTLVVDLQHRGGAFVSVVQAALEPERPARTEPEDAEGRA